MSKKYTFINQMEKKFEYTSLKEGCAELGLTERLINYTLEKWKDSKKHRYQKYHKGYRLIVQDEPKELYTGVLVSDIHFNYEDKNALDILYQILEDYKEDIDEYIDLGDGINNNALSRFTDTEKNKFKLIDEIDSYVNHMYKVKNILKKAKFVAVEDNHYHLRKKKFIAENPYLKGMLKEIDFPFDVQVRHGMLYYPFNQSRIGMLHGVRASKYVTAATLTNYTTDIVHAHTHSSQHFTSSDGLVGNNIYPRKGWGIPSMCTQMEYTNGVPSRQNTGFAFLTYDSQTDNYSFEYIFVENNSAIFRGKKYLTNN